MHPFPPSSFPSLFLEDHTVQFQSGCRHAPTTSPATSSLPTETAIVRDAFGYWKKSSWVDLHRTSWGGNAQILSRSPISTPTALLQRGIAKKKEKGVARGDRKKTTTRFPPSD